MRLPRILAPRVTASAHCDLPCGVYDPAQARIEAESVKMIYKTTNEVHNNMAMYCYDSRKRADRERPHHRRELPGKIIVGPDVIRPLSEPFKAKAGFLNLRVSCSTPRS